MRIVINCRSILKKNRTGIGRYTYHLLDKLGAVGPTEEIVLYAPMGLFDVKRRLPPFPYSAYVRKVERFGFPPPQGDIYHVPSPSSIEPFPGKVIVTVHDLIHKTYPQSHTQQTIDLSEAAMEAVTKRAEGIICVSESTRNDLLSFYPYPKERTFVVPNGVDHDIFFPLKDRGQAEKFLKQIGIPAKFILFVGTIEPRKNLAGLLEAMAMLKTDIPLVVVGMKGWMTGEIVPKIEIMGLKERVIFTGFISDAQLNFLYNTCTVFVFPSLYEGFGFPILEAFASGACVVCSSCSSCPEIAGDAAVYAEPHDHSAIAARIAELLDNSVMRTAYKNKALRRAQEFSFTRTAEGTLKVYREIKGV